MVLYPDAGTRYRNQPEHHNGCAANHRCRNSVDQRTKLRRETGEDGDDRRGDKCQRRVDFGHRHHPDIFGIGGDATAADRAGEHGGQAIANKSASHVRIEIASGHARHRFQMPEVFSHQNDRHRGDKHHRLQIKGGSGGVRQTKPGGL
ncbi:Uncharacterised protein [Pantoea agglomerans]|uniref:Uncharacterized protein n=1 Tax=Enterobacter agglomerans TaxID=549 RepID=A0A379AI36_ENTAG|nr:Uncharacterised protein [Pantoea agglomerans]